MGRVNLALTLLTFALLYSQSSACKGCVDLDEYSFAKVLPKFKALVVKFDAAYPYGEKHDNFVKFAEELVGNNVVLVGLVGVKDYGDKENEEFSSKLGVDIKSLPAIRIFLGSTDNQIKYEDEDITVENLRRFIVDNTDIRLVLPGCIEKLDELAVNYVKASDKEGIIKKARKLTESLEEREQTSAKPYITYMQKIVEKGASFVSAEINRLKKLIKDGKMGEKKKGDLSRKLNVLFSFKVAKDEL